MARMSRAKAPSYPKFLAQILAPLAPTAEAVADKAFLRTVRNDVRLCWNEGMTHVRLAHHQREASDMLWLIARRTGGDVAHADRERDNAQQAYWDQCDRQMRLPAPHKQALKWKCDTRHFGGVHAAWEAAIAADEARLCKGEAK